MPRMVVNEKVIVTSVYFRSHGLSTFPRRIELANGASYTFRDGLRCLVRKGQEAFNMFYMTDGSSNYRLKCDDQHNDWTLLTITPEV